MRSLKHQLLDVAGAFQATSGLSRSRVSTRIFNDGKLLDRLHGESDLTTGRYEGALLWLSDNWPVGADDQWPTEVPRPPKSPMPAKLDDAPQPGEAA